MRIMSAAVKTCRVRYGWDFSVKCVNIYRRYLDPEKPNI